MGLNKKKNPNIQRIKRIQNRRLKQLVKRAYEFQFYKERFDKAGIKPSDINCSQDLSKLPVLTKDELRVWINTIKNDSKYKYYFKDTTSGSTGTPLTILYSPREKAYNMANWLRVLTISGCKPIREKSLSRVDVHSQSGHNQTILSKFGILEREFIEQYKDAKSMINDINTFKPDILSLNKAEFVRLAMYSIGNKLEIHHPNHYIPIGEKIDDNSKRLLYKVFGSGMIDAYGSAETGSIMFRTNEDEYIINNDLFALNIINNGELLVTPLYKKSIPLINYKIGDSVDYSIDNENIHIYSINGRLNDFIKTKDGELISFFEIAHVFSNNSDLYQIKIIQESIDKLVIYYVKNYDSDIDDKELERNLSDELNAHLLNRFSLDYVCVDSIAPSSNGKLRVVESMI
ncbi:MAG: hypothetical protein IJS03_06750 [Eubacterium sp.]|nr:hypothetical protein [Eubacterium sp.]